MPGIVEAVSQRGGHHFSKRPGMWITLLAGLGVEGDGHAGTTVQHCSRVARDPTQPNLRQVHLLHRELLDELETKGFLIGPGDIGENILNGRCRAAWPAHRHGSAHRRRGSGAADRTAESLHPA